MGGKRYTKKEELANGITHGIGVLFGIVALTILLIMAIKKREVFRQLFPLVFMELVLS